MHKIALAATAAITAVGLNATQTAASVRAGISRIRTFAYQTSCSSSSSGLFEASVPDECLPAMDSQLPPVEKRLLQLTAATAGQLAHIRLADIPLVVGLAPGAFAGHSEPDILHMMAEGLGATIASDGSHVLKQGRAAGLMAIAHACRLIADNKADTVLAGGCETFHDPDLLGRLNIANRVKSRTAMDFFVPGEGAVNSGTHKGVCKFVTYSFDVKFEGRGVCRVGDSLLHNNQNTAGGIQTGEQILPFNPVCTTCEAQKNKQTEGHPIDVATGRAFTTAKLFACARPYTMSLFRTWLSTNNEIPGLFGLGWSSLLDTRVELHHEQVHYYDDEQLCHIFTLDAKGSGTAFDNRVAVQEDQIEVKERRGRTFHFAFDPDSGDSRLEWITQNGLDLIYLEYENDHLCAIKDAAGYTYRFIRDHHNRVIAIDRHIPGEKRTRLAGFDYDARNRLIEARDPMGHMTTYAYNDADLLVQETDPGGFSFYYEYDDEQRCIKNHGDNGKYLRRFAYNPDENETIVTNGLGHRLTYYYKYTGLVEYALDELGHSYLQLHDENGYLISEIDKNKRIFNYQHDQQDRTTVRTDPNNKRWRTYYDGNRTVHKDPFVTGNAKMYQKRD
jgi:YD repeat-containing protein